MGNHKQYTGPRLPCGWPGCESTLKNPDQLHKHWVNCLGHGLPPLKTSIKCDITDCCCHGVEFPSIERLDRHKAHERRVSANKLKGQKQCLSQVCGCGLWFVDLASHLRPTKKRKWKGPQMEKGQAQHLISTMEKNKDSLFVGDENEPENGEVDLHTGEEQVTENEIKEEVQDDDEHPGLMTPKSGSMGMTRYADNQQDTNTTFKTPQFIGQKRARKDMTRDNDDGIDEEVVKKVRVKPSVAFSQSESSSSDSSSGMVSNLLEIIKSQQDTIQLQQRHIQLLSGVAVRRK